MENFEDIWNRGKGFQWYKKIPVHVSRVVGNASCRYTEDLYNQINYWFEQKQNTDSKVNLIVSQLNVVMNTGEFVTWSQEKKLHQGDA